MGRDDRSMLMNVRLTAPRAARRAALAMAAIAGLALPVNRAMAANGTWSGTAGDGLWATPGNWDTVPGTNDGTFVSTDVATFNIPAGATPTITVDANRNVGGITFDTNADAYTFAGAALHLTGGGTTQITAPVASPTFAETFNNNLSIEGASYTLLSGSTSFTYFAIGGNVSTNVASGSATLTLTGTNNAFLSGGALAGFNAISGVIDKGTATSLNLNITGSAWVLSAANTYGGTTTVDGANTYLAVDNNSALSTGLLVLQNGAHLKAQSAPVTLANDLNLPSGIALIDGASSITLTGGTTFTGGSTLRNNMNPGQTLTLGNVFLSNSLATPRSITFDGSGATVVSGSLADSNGVGGTVNLVKAGSASSLTILSSNSSYTGAVTLNAGTLILGADTALGPNNLTAAGGIIQGTGTGTRMVANNVVLTGTAVVVNGAQDITFTGSITNSGANRSLGAQSTTNAVTFAGPIYLSETSGTGRALTIDGGSASAVQPFSITGVISNFNGVGGAAGNLIKAGFGNLTLAANNTYTGTTTINQGTLTIGNGGTTGSVAGAIAFGASGTHLRFNRSGTYTIANAITGAGDVGTSGPAGSVYTTTTAYTYSGGFVLGNGNTFLLATDSTPTSGTAIISGPFGIGPFSVATSPSSDSTGQILQPTGGSRTIGNSVNLANNLTVQGSFNLSLTGGITLTNSRSLVNNLDAGKTLTLGLSGVLVNLSGPSAVHTFGGTGATNVLSNISGSGQQVAKLGSGSLTFNGTGAYNGGTTISAGTLVAATAFNTSPLGTGDITVNAGRLNLAPTGSGNAIAYSGASLSSTTHFNYGPGAVLGLNKGSQTSLSFTVGNASPSSSVIQRTSHGTMVIAPASGTANLGSGEKILTTSGGAPAVNNGIVDASIVGQNNDGSASGDFLNYGASGFVKATYSAATDINAAGATAVYNANSSGAGSNVNTLAAAAAVYAINTAGQTVDTGGFQLTVGTSTPVGTPAGVILNGGGITGGTLAFGDAEALVYTSAAGASISSAITGNSGATFFGPGSILLSGANTYSGNTNINSGTFTLDAAGSLTSTNVTVVGGATANVNGTLSSSATVNANGAVNFGGNTTAVTLNRQLAALNVGAGATAKVNASTFPFTPVVLNPATLTFADNTAKLNLTNNELITSGTLAGVVSQIVSGQIFSTNTGGGLGTLDLGGGNIEVRFTLLGDTNLDGSVDVTDLGNLASSYGAASGAKWVQGDTNYDGAVDVTDLGNLASNYGGQLASGPSAGAPAAAMSATSLATVADSGSAAVPEPTALGLLVTTALLAARRRRR